MSYKIVVDSCCELPEQFRQDERFEIVPLMLEVGEYHVIDDEHFDQARFLREVAECPTCPKSSCPSPEAFRQAYRSEADHIYVVTLSSKLSGSYNSAVLGNKLYQEKYGEKKIYVFDSLSAACGETQIVLKIMELEDKGLPFEEVVKQVEKFRDTVSTYFVLDNLETLRKNGRMSGMKALVASTLSIKPIMAGDRGSIVQKGQAIGIKKALGKLADLVIADAGKNMGRRLMITHCNALERAEYVRDLVLAKADCLECLILDARGVSSMYANDGGVVVTI